MCAQVILVVSVRVGAVDSRYFCTLTQVILVVSVCARVILVVSVSISV